MEQGAPGAIAVFRPALEAGRGLSADEAAGRIRQAQVAVLRGENMLRRFLESGDEHYLTESGVSLYTLGHLVARLSEGLRHQDIRRLQYLCEWVVGRIGEPQEEWEFDLAARLLAELANCLRIRGLLSEAREVMDRAHEAARVNLDDLTQGIVNWLDAVLFRELNDNEGSRTACHKAIHYFRSIYDQGRVNGVRFLLAKLSFLEGELDQAASELVCLREEVETDDITRLSATLLLAKIHVLSGSLFEVPDLLRELRRLNRAWTALPDVAAHTEWLIALILGSTGNPGGAALRLRRVAATFQRLDKPIDAAIALIDRAAFELEAGACDQAIESAGLALRTFEAHGQAYPEAFRALKTLAEAVKASDLSRRSFLGIRLQIEQAAAR